MSLAESGSDQIRPVEFNIQDNTLGPKPRETGDLARETSTFFALKRSFEGSQLLLNEEGKNLLAEMQGLFDGSSYSHDKLSAVIARAHEYIQRVNIPEGDFNKVEVGRRYGEVIRRLREANAKCTKYAKFGNSEINYLRQEIDNALQSPTGNLFDLEAFVRQLDSTLNKFEEANKDSLESKANTPVQEINLTDADYADVSPVQKQIAVDENGNTREIKAPEYQEKGDFAPDIKAIQEVYKQFVEISDQLTESKKTADQYYIDDVITADMYDEATEVINRYYTYVQEKMAEISKYMLELADNMDKIEADPNDTSLKVKIFMDLRQQPLKLGKDLTNTENALDQELRGLVTRWEATL